MEANFVEGKYTFQEMLDMVETKIEKWLETKDYNKFTEKLLKELMPIIETKVNAVVVDDVEDNTEDKVNVEETLREKAKTNDDDLPF